MTQKEMDLLTRHFCHYFQQEEPMVLHPEHMEPHIDGLLYKPDDTFPFWKFVTMGASDHRMKAPKSALGNRNEYMMFIDPEVDMTDKETVNWYWERLLTVALYSLSTGDFVSYGHSMEWPAEEGEEMVGAYLEMPQCIPDVGVLRCKLGLFKTTVCLQVITLTRQELDKLLCIGSEQFSYFLYPDEGKPHYLCERTRSEKF